MSNICSPALIELISSPSDLHRFAIVFADKNKSQVKQKAKKFNLEKDEMTNIIFEFIVDNLHKYEPARATFEAFVFGAIEASHTYSNDALDRSQNVSDEIFEVRHEAALQSAATDDFQEPENFEECPGSANLRAVAAVVAGQNSTEIGANINVSKRRANQKLKQLCEVAQVQFGLNFGEESV
jgi:hypothetical protein